MGQAVKPKRVDVRLTEQQRCRLEEIARAQRATLTDTICALIDEKAIMLTNKKSEAGLVLADSGFAL